MLTNKFYSVIRPFFVSRGSWQLATNDMLDNYVNLVLQDIYNFHEWKFKNIAEELTSYNEVDGKRVWVTKYHIDSVTKVEDQDGNTFNPTFKTIKESTDIEDSFEEYRCNVGENFIVTNSDVESISIEYVKAFEWFTYEDLKNKPLPVPSKFVPAVMMKVYDLASPLNYFDDDSVVPRYQIAERMLNNIKVNDGVSTDVYFAPWKGF